MNRKNLSLSELKALKDYVNKEIKEKKKKYYYKVCAVDHPCKKMNQSQMIKYAKKQLSFNKKNFGMDKEIKSSDLNKAVNAWIYLNNIGLARGTNRKLW
jgi:hypothetical protein